MTLDFFTWPDSLGSISTAFLLGYALGSIPFGLLFTKMAGLGDIRAIGSGNIGTTNVLRTGRKDIAALTLACDALKGILAVLVADYLGSQSSTIAAALGAFLGHLFPIWLRFKGGKGVATYLGLAAIIAWPSALIFVFVWVIVGVATRYASLASLIASAASAVAVWFFADWKIGALFAVLCLGIWGKHHSNIRRLIAKTESRIGAPS